MFFDVKRFKEFKLNLKNNNQKKIFSYVLLYKLYKNFLKSIKKFEFFK